MTLPDELAGRCVVDLSGLRWFAEAVAQILKDRHWSARRIALVMPTGQVVLLTGPPPQIFEVSATQA